VPPEGWQGAWVERHFLEPQRTGAQHSTFNNQRWDMSARWTAIIHGIVFAMFLWFASYLWLRLFQEDQLMKDWAHLRVDPNSGPPPVQLATGKASTAASLVYAPLVTLDFAITGDRVRFVDTKGRFHIGSTATF